MCATGSDVAPLATVKFSQVDAPQSGLYVYGSKMTWSKMPVVCATGAVAGTPATVNISQVDAPESGSCVYGSNT